MTDWVYPQSLKILFRTAEWLAAIGAVFLVFLLLSWAFLPVEKTNRHYMSICLTAGVLMMNASQLSCRYVLQAANGLNSSHLLFLLQQGPINATMTLLLMVWILARLVPLLALFSFLAAGLLSCGLFFARCYYNSKYAGKFS